MSWKSEMIMKRILLMVGLVVCLAGCGNDRLGGDAETDTSVPGSGLVEEAEARMPEAEALPESLAISGETFVAQSAARRSALTGFTRARSSMTLVSEESGRVQKARIKRK